MNFGHNAAAELGPNFPHILKDACAPSWRGKLFLHTTEIHTRVLMATEHPRVSWQ